MKRNILYKFYIKKHSCVCALFLPAHVSLVEIIPHALHMEWRPRASGSVDGSRPSSPILSVAGPLTPSHHTEPGLQPSGRGPHLPPQAIPGLSFTWASPFCTALQRCTHTHDIP